MQQITGWQGLVGRSITRVEHSGAYTALHLEGERFALLTDDYSQGVELVTETALQYIGAKLMLNLGLISPPEYAATIDDWNRRDALAKVEAAQKQLDAARARLNRLPLGE